MSYVINELGNGKFEIIDSDFAHLYPDLDFEQMPTLTDEQYQVYCQRGNHLTKWIDGQFIYQDLIIEQEVVLEQLRQQIRTKINARRDKCVNGGIFVPEIGKWVDTDEKGRATLVEIKADFDLNGKEDNGEPRIFTLICADNTAEPLDFDKFKAVWNAVKKLKEKMFENAYMHKVLLEAEANPLDYDWSIGWSQTYEEHKNAQEK
ncbi:DUF4376 domain-containing protein [Avibacterium avium]|uniref:DUF4376 domain-containing protein n=1 Tax=Avibacterium avium TaxID=751 RepID=UPI003BF8CC77